MKTTNVRMLAFALCMSVTVAGCGDSEGGTQPEPTLGPERSEVIEAYGELVSLAYADCLETALDLQQAVDAFVEDPSAERLKAAKDAWKAARIPYGQTEAFRFYDGPIDNADGPEGRLNAWPLDEQYIDYVEGAEDAGIINDLSIDIDKASLSELTEGGSGDVLGIGADFDPDKAIASGYHAIEFLLWGQDLSDSGSGARPWEDYLTTDEATHPNGDRRGAFLKAAAELLVDDLKEVAVAWEPDAENFRASFTKGDPDEALIKIITALGILSKGELAGERMDVALTSFDQEDEHSCFSDNTHVDVEMNALGVENVYLGRYRDLDGPGIDELVAALDPDVDAEMKKRLTASLTAARAIPAPFDQAIAEEGSPGWNAVDEAVGALFDQGDYFVTVASTLGLGSISVELPE